MRLRLEVNGRQVDEEVEPRTLLVYFLRDGLGLKGTNVGCDTSSCGACTVLMGGRSVKSCTVLALQAEGASLTTIEGLAGQAAGGAAPEVPGDDMHPVQRAFREHHALQCGYCTPGMVMAVTSLIAHAEPGELDEQAVRRGLEGNLCRCTGYHNIVAAALAAARHAGVSR